MLTLTAAFIWIPKEKVTLKDKMSNGKKNGVTTYDKFGVTQIIIENGVINALAIKNISTGKMAFTVDNREKK